MPKINVLPKNVAELIAAGEVVERPASVVKELVENAVDADAARITVEIKNGGSRYIRVTDDGCGIAPEDVRTAFLPHATSKIASEADLDRIFTLGFRGEALPSIASVSKTTLLTRTPDAEEGAVISFEGGEETAFGEAGCPAGTTVTVRDLFFNTPARMKFLKKDVTEGNLVADAVTRAALSHPDILFTFLRDEKRVFSTPGNGDLYACIYALFGREVSEQLLKVEYAPDGMRVDGYISRPLANRPNRSMQYFFVNGRTVRIPAASSALDRAYQNSIMVGKFPMCFLSLTLPCTLTDVNVHPAKTEIRFSEESAVYETVFYAARSALGSGDTARAQVSLHGKHSLLDESGAPPRQLSMTAPPAPAKTPASPAESPVPAPAPKAEARVKTVFEPVYPAPPRVTPSVSLDIPYSEPAQNGTRLQSDVAQKIAAPAVPRENAQRDFQKEFSDLSKNSAAPKTPFAGVRVLGEAFRTYIIAEADDRLLLIDKHAAHERMIFNELTAADAPPQSQLLLTPAVVGLSGAEYAAVTEHIEVFRKAGYEIEDFGAGSVIVRACPMLLTGEDVSGLVRELAGKLIRGELRPENEKLQWIFNSTACRAAVKAGDEMKPAEMQMFVRRLLSDESVKYCPHGRPVLYELTRKELEKQFGRTQ